MAVTHLVQGADTTLRRRGVPLFFLEGMLQSLAGLRKVTVPVRMRGRPQYMVLY